MRKFVWCRQELAERCSIKTDHVHIAITSPGCRMVRPACGKKTLRLLFYDLDPESIRRTNAFADDPVRGKEIVEGCFTEAQARKIARFVERTAESKVVVVNCEAGISRSPGVVLALRRRYGGNADAVFKDAIPNMHVTSTLSRVLREITERSKRIKAHKSLCPNCSYHRYPCMGSAIREDGGLEVCACTRGPCIAEQRKERRVAEEEVKSKAKV